MTQAQIDAVGEIMKDVLAAVKKGNYSSAESHLDAAEAVLKNTSAPWLLKRINYLQKGLNGVQTAKAKKSMGASLVAYATAPQPSWTWQLRDRLGQWLRCTPRSAGWTGARPAADASWTRPTRQCHGG